MSDTIRRVLRKKKVLLVSTLVVHNAKLEEMQEDGILDETLVEDIKVNMIF